MWSESVTRTSREVYLSLSLWLHIAIEWVPNPIVKDPSESLVDRVLRSIFNEANQNPVAMVQKVLIKPSHRSETAVQYYYNLGVPPFHFISFFSCWCCCKLSNLLFRVIESFHHLGRDYAINLLAIFKKFHNLIIVDLHSNFKVRNVFLQRNFRFCWASWCKSPLCCGSWCFSHFFILIILRVFSDLNLSRNKKKPP